MLLKIERLRGGGVTGLGEKRTVEVGFANEVATRLSV
jgi:hypothetical protein